ncbi:hypothetical protein [Arthrobacter sp. GMC3]|uniref:hypothetical protein n=1 Tax=Arthrobacter sp. GMC3 TaxID=2058894 RepID=UPI000CE42300|nr:hypothetical protein [Arthrobacter sp. GMC3]
MSRVDRALEIQALIEAAIAAAGLKNVLVTLDSQDVEAALFHGPVVVVQPPKLTFSTFTIMDAVWDVYVVSGPKDNRIESWRRTDDVIDAMELAYMPLGTAEPANFQTRSNAYPAYILTLNETLQLTP